MVGVLFTRNEAVVSTELAGRLESLPCELGQSVAAGAVIAQLDDRTLRENLARAEAQLESARADSSLKASERAEMEERYERRTKTADSYSAEEMSQVRLARARAAENSATAAATVKAARADVAALRLRLDSARIRAPFRGVIAMRYQTPGTWLDVGAPIARIVGESQLWVRFAAPPAQSGCLAPGTRIAVRAPGMAAELAGIVRNVSPEIDPASGLLTIEASLTDHLPSRSGVHAGLAVRVRLARDRQR